MSSSRRSFVRQIGAVLGALFVLPKEILSPSNDARKPDPDRYVYNVGPKQEFKSMKAAIDRVWFDHDSRPFTHNLIIQSDEGVYNEGIHVPEALNPTEDNRLIIKPKSGYGVLFDVPEDSFCIEQPAKPGIDIGDFVFWGEKSKGAYCVHIERGHYA